MTSKELKLCTEGWIARFADGHVIGSAESSAQIGPNVSVYAQFEIAYHTARLADAQERMNKWLSLIESQIRDAETKAWLKEIASQIRLIVETS